MDDRRTEGRRWNAVPADSDDRVVAATALVVLGAGLGSLFGVPLLAAVDFWLIFVIGYAVVVPLVSLFRGRRSRDGRVERPGRDSETEGQHAAEGSAGEDVDSALSRLRERYASGELSEEQFERKLEALLETETPEDARERIERSKRSERSTESAHAERESEIDRT
ncbi:SHOCT domain-containing protein [Halobellus ordinarius]|uniref:SHOCT domain-containing protein n=1 Tax=Halobellus ordinarius TaxID=3075120 RepID=UPI0028809DB4|nr:SHOCT domain-containing protein [Halobellus sp. ZY16]